MELEDYLRTRLAGPLPGSQAHKQLVPDVPSATQRLKGPPEGAKKSAVLIPLLTKAHAFPDVMFTVRSERLRSHRGQISFPGGRLDPGETLEEAALRELNEETGIETHDVLVLGQLSPLFIPPSNSAVTPYVGLVRKPDKYVISEAEVREIFDIPLTQFIDRDSIKTMKREMFGRMVDVPYWPVHKEVPLWGATAMILNELMWLVREYLNEYQTST